MPWQDAEKTDAKAADQPLRLSQLVLLLATSVVQSFGETVPWLCKTPKRGFLGFLRENQYRDAVDCRVRSIVS